MLESIALKISDYVKLHLSRWALKNTTRLRNVNCFKAYIQSVFSALYNARDGGAQLVVIDTAPHSESSALAAIRAADLILIPCQPSILDLRAIANTIDLVKLAKKTAIELRRL